MGGQLSFERRAKAKNRFCRLSRAASSVPQNPSPPGLRHGAADTYSVFFLYFGTHKTMARENFDLKDSKFRSAKPMVPLTGPLPISTIKRMSSASQIRCQCCTCCCMCASTGARELLT